jgi:hypothetical protein
VIEANAEIWSRRHEPLRIGGACVIHSSAHAFTLYNFSTVAVARKQNCNRRPRVARGFQFRTTSRIGLDTRP